MVFGMVIHKYHVEMITKKWEGHKCLRKWDIIQMQKKIQDGNSTRLIKHGSLGSTDTFKNN